jgi:hypothetical protein
LLLFPLQSQKIPTAEELFIRNGGTREQRYRQFPPHKIIGNVYYVGTVDPGVPKSYVGQLECRPEESHY